MDAVPTSTYFYTIHPVDMARARIMPGAAILAVASGFWDHARRRFKIKRPPADHIGALAIDSGGFTMAAKYGEYPWAMEQYIDFIREMSRDVPLTFCACMDYACEREVNRGIYATNRDRIKATIYNEIALRALAPDLPWLGVLQGNTIEERALDVALRRRIGLLTGYMGIGSICRRGPVEASRVIDFYGEQLPGTRYHAFGLSIRTLDTPLAPRVFHLLQSWDSYVWGWNRGKYKGVAPHLIRRQGETQTNYTYRLALAYEEQTIRPRQERPRQLVLL
jgi:hypothetical protein